MKGLVPKESFWTRNFIAIVTAQRGGKYKSYITRSVLQDFSCLNIVLLAFNPRESNSCELVELKIPIPGINSTEMGYGPYALTNKGEILMAYWTFRDFLHNDACCGLLLIDKGDYRNCALRSIIKLSLMTLRILSLFSDKQYNKPRSSSTMDLKEANRVVMWAHGSRC